MHSQPNPASCNMPCGNTSCISVFTQSRIHASRRLPWHLIGMPCSDCREWACLYVHNTYRLPSHCCVRDLGTGCTAAIISALLCKPACSTKQQPGPPTYLGLRYGYNHAQLLHCFSIGLQADSSTAEHKRRAPPSIWFAVRMAPVGRALMQPAGSV
jgi:hypothetical protein